MSIQNTIPITKKEILIEKAILLLDSANSLSNSYSITRNTKKIIILNS